MMTFVRSPIRIWPALLAALTVFVVYLRTMAPTIFPLDSAELTVAAKTLGLVHSPGYPVYLLLSHLFTYLPVRDIAYRVNLLSNIAATGAVLILVLLLKKMTRNWFTAFVAGLSFGFSFYTWSLSLAAEVYTLQVFLLAATLLAWFYWQQSGSEWMLLTVIFLAGLSLSNNPASLLLGPGLLLLVLKHKRHISMTWQLAFKAIAVFVLGLTPVLYIPIRSFYRPEFVYFGSVDATGVFHPLDLTRLDNLMVYLSGGQFSDLIFGYSPRETLMEGIRFLHWLWAAFLGVGLPLGIWGIILLWKHNRTLAYGLLLAILPHIIFFVSYRAPDKDTMFLPVFFVWALFLGIGLEGLVAHLSKPGRLFVLLLPVSLLIVNIPYADVSDLGDPRDVAETRLRTAEMNAVYLSSWGDSGVMEYLQSIEGLRPDIDVINLFFIENLAAKHDLIVNALQSGRPVYSTFSDPALENDFVFTPVKHGYELTLRR